MTLIRKVRNETDHSFTLMVPGFNTSQTPAVVLAPSVIVDLLSLVTDDELEAMQGEIQALIASGSVSDQGDVASLRAVTPQPQVTLTDVDPAAVGYVQADMQALVDLVNALKTTINAMNS